MPLAPCARCKKLFNKQDIPVCQSCESDEESDYDRVRIVLDENPNLSTQEVADKAEVDVSVVKRMLDRGTIAIMTGTEDVKCGRCGAPAISLAKRLCESCLEKLNAEMLRAQSTIKLGEKKAPEIGKYNVRQSVDDKRRG